MHFREDIMRQDMSGCHRFVCDKLPHYIEFMTHILPWDDLLKEQTNVADGFVVIWGHKRQVFHIINQSIMWGADKEVPIPVKDEADLLLSIILRKMKMVAFS